MNRRLLAIDIGNSQTTVGLFDGDRLLDTWRLSTRVPRTVDELWIVLDHLIVAHPRPTTAAISSVVPELTRLYTSLIRDRLGVEPLVIGAACVRSLKVDYDPPSAVGADRLCGAVAGFKEVGGPLILVDLGTATVFDVVTADGVYRGGLIAPGLLTAAESLHRAAALLPVVDLQFPPGIVGSSTEAAIQSGILHGALAMIDGIVDRIQSTLATRAHVIATGGLAGLLQKHSRTIERVEPDLVLRGIRYVSEEQ